MGQPNAVAHVDDGTLGCGNALQQFLYLTVHQSVVNGVDDLVGVKFAQLVLVDHSALHVQRNVEPHRAWPSVQGDGYGLVQFKLHVEWVVDGLGILRDGCHHRHDVGLLVAQLSKRQLWVAVLVGRGLDLT